MPASALAAAEDAVHTALVLHYLLGRAHVAAHAVADGHTGAGGPLAFADDPDSGEGGPPLVRLDGEREALTMSGAVDALRARVPVSPEEFAALDAAVRLRAFAVARVAVGDALVAVQAALTDGLADGAAPDDVRAAVRAALARHGASPLAAHHVDLVVRNNTAAAYGVGRWAQFGALGDALDALAFVGVRDRRQSSVCRPFNGLVAAPDDPVWAYAYPPNHHACRSTVRAVLAGTREAGARTPPAEVAAMGRPSDHGAGEGWDASAVSIADLSALPRPVLERAAAYGHSGAIEELERQAAEALAGALAAGAPAPVSYRTFVDDVEADAYLDPFDTTALPKAQADAVDFYQSNQAFPFNAWLRTGLDDFGQPVTGPRLDRFERMRDDLDAAFTKALTEGVQVWRGVGAKGRAVLEAVVGGTYSDPAFLSTSLLERKAAGVFLESGGAMCEVYLDPGTLVVAPHPKFEFEALLQRGVRFSVEDAGPYAHPSKKDVRRFILRQAPTPPPRP